MRHSSNYNFRLPERVEGRNDPANIDDLTYNLESMDGLLRTQADAVAQLEQGKVGTAELQTHAQNGVLHLTTEERDRWNAGGGRVTWASIADKPVNYPPAPHGHAAATGAADGFLPAADKAKLDSVERGANNYRHPDSSSVRHVTDTEKAAWNGKASSSHSHPAGGITAGTLPSGVVAQNAADYGTQRLRNCCFATAAPGWLGDGVVCFVYE